MYFNCILTRWNEKGRSGQMGGGDTTGRSFVSNAFLLQEFEIRDRREIALCPAQQLEEICAERRLGGVQTPGMQSIGPEGAGFAVSRSRLRNRQAHCEVMQATRDLLAATVRC